VVVALDKVVVITMHPLVRSVLLWPPGMNTLVLDPESHPPDVEIRQPVDGLSGEWHAVIGANSYW